MENCGFDCVPVIVCGAGAAGIAAAISASRFAEEVWLVEERPRVGGTVTHSLIHTLGGFFDACGEPINDGLVPELADRLQRTDRRVGRRKMGRAWVLQVDPAVYAAAVQDWLSERRNIRVLTSSRITAAVVDGGRVSELEFTATGESIRIRPDAVIDATGTAEVARLIDSESVEDDPECAAGGWIFTMGPVDPSAIRFPRGLGIVRALRSAREAGSLPELSANAWIDIGPGNDEVYVKLAVPLRDSWRGQRGTIVREARQAQLAVADYLMHLPEFAHATIRSTGELGVRDGGRIRGEYRLSSDDVLAGRSFADGVCRCAWPIEYWHPERGVSLTYPENGAYDIPLRALKLRGYENVWAAGKCLSADRLAQASARVVGTCWAMGAAVGEVAARVESYAR